MEKIFYNETGHNVLKTKLQKIDQSEFHKYYDDIMVIMHRSFDPQYGEAWNIDQLKSMLSMPYIHLWIASGEACDPIGFAIVRTLHDESEVMLIAVLPDFQGQSVGRAILDNIIVHSKAMDVKHLFLEVRANNRALKFYQECGFFKTGLRKDYYKGNENTHYDALTLAMSVTKKI